MEYAVTSAVLDPYSDFSSFSDAAVLRAEAQQLVERVELDLLEGREELLSGEVEIELHTDRGVARHALKHPPGSTENPPSAADLAAKVAACLHGSGVTADDVTWESAAQLLRSQFPPPHTYKTMQTGQRQTWMG